MSQETFNETYEPLRNLTLDKLKALKKDDLLQKFSDALIVLKCADKVISKQSDTILGTSNEVVKLSSQTRDLIIKLEEKTRNVLDGTKNPIAGDTYASVASKSTHHPILIKQNKNGPNFNKKETQKKVEEALSKINVSSTKITRNGDFLINLPDTDSSKKATESLNSIFTDKVSIEPARKIMPKLTIVGFPADHEVDSTVTMICNKDSNLKDLIDEGETFEIVKCFELKDYSDTVVSKKLVVKVSAKIRNYIMSVNEGYLYVGLVRCKVYDRLIVPQCYHCYEFYHFSQNCPKKSKSPTCGKCSKSHETKNCRSSQERCVNCVNKNPNEENNHPAYSYKCPAIEREVKNLQHRTDYTGEKN